MTIAATAMTLATPDGRLDAELKSVLKKARFTGKIESTLEARLGRRINPQLANLGRLLWFDKCIARPGQHVRRLPFTDERVWRHPIHRDGVQNNNKVGPHRTGPRNQRRSPLVVNTVFLRS